MASNLSATFSIQGSYTLTGSGTVTRNTDSASIGSNGFDAMSITWTYGTGSQAAKQIYAAERTLAATTQDSLDMAGGLTNGLGETITFTTLKFALVVLDAPNGTRVLHVGPNGVSNAWSAPWQINVDEEMVETADAYLKVYEWFLWTNSYSNGSTVTASTGDLFCVYNPTGSSITYRILLMGQTA